MKYGKPNWHKALLAPPSDWHSDLKIQFKRQFLFIYCCNTLLGRISNNL